ncbi:arginine utilization regulatory protein [Caldalkalibacillus uzonensis]|uniref:Arginine utilization regulatory protein n=1 Tax=Caldalkalibacillus uzonensis TaxID=353224 RepID=A0ABU0CXY0_9BACI|nr:sigma-54-dependent Fis family transcriptional regulator [Caldalkalibacillus uzonensis]MDQ0340989.1 arginine utilization regulatory protein [Caldalkalibacillus uzonensis]
MEVKEGLKNLKIMDTIYKKLLDEIDVGIHVIDAHGKTIIYNKKMMQIESMDIEDVVDRNLMDAFMFEKENDSTLLQALKFGKTTKNVKQTYFNRKGQEITTINDTFPVIENGQIIGAIEIAKDVTRFERFIKKNMLKKRDAKYTFESIIGKSKQIKEVIEYSKRATRTSSSVLIVGETGTGKELFAQSIHNGSNRSSKPFIAQNCAALPSSLIESILFGTKKGAFTGATEHPGLFEQAKGGTLLLDEINSLNLDLQAKLLRALQEKKIRRIGDTKDIEIDVRIIATINEDPIDAISKGRLRKDLYYRLSVVSLFIPPLRERKEDIPLLVQSFIDKYNYMFQMNVRGINEEVLQLFYDYDWPGNVRELEHTIEGAMNLIVDEETIDYNHLPIQFRNKSKLKKMDAPIARLDLWNKENPSVKTLKEHMEEVEKYYIGKVLKDHNFNISRAAQTLGISRQSLQYRLRKLGISSTKL